MTAPLSDTLLDGKAALAEHVARARDAREAFLEELVRAPSENPPGDCAPHAAFTAERLEELGFTVERHYVPAAAARAQNMKTCTNLIVRERFGPGPVIACNAHGDTVPAGRGWTVDPYAGCILDGRLYGRGAAIAKSDFATYAFALLALKSCAAAGATLQGAVELHFTYDGEAGGTNGPARLLELGLTHPSYAICSGFAYGVATAHNGCLQLEVALTGRTAHATEPEKGVDALHAATMMMSHLYEHRRSLANTRSQLPGIGPPTLVIASISGGSHGSLVPERVVFRLDRRVLPEESSGKVERDLTSQIRDFADRLPNVHVAVRRVLLAKPFAPTAGQEKLVDAVRRNARDVLGEEIWPHGIPRYTDARHYAAHGVPTVVYGAGPRTTSEARVYRADENLPLEDLHRATDVVARTLYDLLSG